MSRMRLYLIAVTLLVLQGCATHVSTDYEPTHSFKADGSFFLMAVTRTPEMSPEISDLNLDRIKTSIRQELAQRYAVIDDKSQASYWVQYHVVLKEKLDVMDKSSMSFHYSRFPNCCFGYGFGLGVDVDQFTEETLIIDVIDAATEKQVWRGYSNYRMRAYADPAKQSTYLQEKVQSILAKFPPQKKP